MKSGKSLEEDFQPLFSRAAKRGGFKRGGFPIWTCPSSFVLFGTSPIFPGISRFARGWSGDFPDSSLFFLFLGLLRAPTRNSPERVRDTIRTFPEKSGKHPGLETPRFSFSQFLDCFDVYNVERILVSKFCEIQHLDAFWPVFLEGLLSRKDKNMKSIHCF